MSAYALLTLKVAILDEPSDRQQDLDGLIHAMGNDIELKGEGPHGTITMTIDSIHGAEIDGVLYAPTENTEIETILVEEG